MNRRDFNKTLCYLPFLSLLNNDQNYIITIYKRDFVRKINFGYARDPRWDVVQRAMQVLEAGFVKKINNSSMSNFRIV